MALGFMLIVGVMETINLAHGSLFALGMYFAIFLITPKLGWFPETQAAYLALPLGTRYGVRCGVRAGPRRRLRHGARALHAPHLRPRPALRPAAHLRRGAGHRGADPRRLGLGREAAAGARGDHWRFHVRDPIYATYRFFAAGFAAVAIGLLWFFLEKTPYGSIVKAGAHDSEMVRALGINLSRLRLFVFALGVGLAAVAGVVMAPIWGMRPQVGVDAVVPAFLIIVLGGVGSFWGAVAAGLLVGLAVGLTGAYASEWSLLSMYLLFIAVVTFRSRGLFGKKSILDT